MPSERFLILDDDKDVGRLMRAVGESAGLESRSACEQEDFFRLVHDWSPTHIAVDLIMPDLDGVQILVRLAESACRSRIIIVSGIGGRILEAARRSAMEYGLSIAGVLPKPFAIAALRTLLVTTPLRGATTADAAAAPDPAANIHRSIDPTAEDLQHALDNQELRVAYQPKIDCATARLVGFEALVRWAHPRLGLIMPNEFIPIAERHQLIDSLTYTVTELALAWIARGFPDGTDSKDAGQFPAPSLAVNLSARTLQDNIFVERIIAQCRRHAINPSRLIIELTESIAMTDPVASLALLTRACMKGLTLSIDDFGTGYSSMVQLVRLPLSEIKIDKSFVMTALHSAESSSVVKSIVHLGHSLGLRVVAEGVEDAETMCFLREIGCDQAQGFYIARAMAGDLALDWASRQQLAISAISADRFERRHAREDYNQTNQ